jgi:hypothetical protein
VSERNAEVIRTEIAAERHGLEGDLDSLKGDARQFAIKAGVATAAAVVTLFVVRRLFR